MQEYNVNVSIFKVIKILNKAPLKLEFRSNSRDVSIKSDPTITNKAFTDIISDDFMRSAFNTT